MTDKNTVIDRQVDWAALTEAVDAEPLSQSPEDYAKGLLAVLEATRRLQYRTGLIVTEDRYIPDAVDADGQECDPMRGRGRQIQLHGSRLSGFTQVGSARRPGGVRHTATER